MNDVWKRELAALRAKIADLDGKLEELLAAGPVAPGVVEAAAELAHEAAQLEKRLSAGPADEGQAPDGAHGD